MHDGFRDDSGPREGNRSHVQQAQHVGLSTPTEPRGSRRGGETHAGYGGRRGGRLDLRPRDLHRDGPCARPTGPAGTDRRTGTTAEPRPGTDETHRQRPSHPRWGDAARRLHDPIAEAAAWEGYMYDFSVPAGEVLLIDEVRVVAECVLVPESKDASHPRESADRCGWDSRTDVPTRRDQRGQQDGVSATDVRKGTGRSGRGGSA